MHKMESPEYSVEVGESQFFSEDLCFRAIQQKMMNILAGE